MTEALSIRSPPCFVAPSAGAFARRAGYLRQQPCPWPSVSRLSRGAKPSNRASGAGRANGRHYGKADWCEGVLARRAIRATRRSVRALLGLVHGHVLLALGAFDELRLVAGIAVGFAVRAFLGLVLNNQFTARMAWDEQVARALPAICLRLDLDHAVKSNLLAALCAHFFRAHDLLVQTGGSTDSMSIHKRPKRGCFVSRVLHRGHLCSSQSSSQRGQ